jgi:hypothetical protein
MPGSNYMQLATFYMQDLTVDETLTACNIQRDQEYEKNSGKISERRKIIYFYNVVGEIEEYHNKRNKTGRGARTDIKYISKAVAYRLKANSLSILKIMNALEDAGWKPRKTAHT